MAIQTYGNGTNASPGVQNQNFMYDRAGISSSATTMKIYTPMTSARTQKQRHGKTFKVSKFFHIYERDIYDSEFATLGYLTGRSFDVVSSELNATDGSGASLTETATNTNHRTVTKITVEASIAMYGEMIPYTEDITLFSEDFMKKEYYEKLGALAGQRYEDLVQRDMLGTPTVHYGGSATMASELDTDSQVSFNDIRRIVRRLRRNNAEKNTSMVTGSTKVNTTPINEAYYAIIGPDIKYDLQMLENNATTSKIVWVPKQEYSYAGNLHEAEVGLIDEVRFIESKGALVYRGHGSAVLSAAQEAAATTIENGSQNTNLLKTTTFNGVDDTALFNAIKSARGTVVFVDASDVNNIKETSDIADVQIGTDTIIDEYFDVFPMLLPTQESFATIGLKGAGKIKFMNNDPSKVDSGNTFGNNGFYSYKFKYAGIILQEEKLLKGLFTASR